MSHQMFYPTMLLLVVVFCDTLDGISDSDDFKYRRHLTKDGSQSDKN